VTPSELGPRPPTSEIRPCSPTVISVSVRLTCLGRNSASRQPSTDIVGLAVKSSSLALQCFQLAALQPTFVLGYLLVKQLLLIAQHWYTGNGRRQTTLGTWRRLGRHVSTRAPPRLQWHIQSTFINKTVPHHHHHHFHLRAFQREPRLHPDSSLFPSSASSSINLSV